MQAPRNPVSRKPELPPDPSALFGLRLRQARERKGLSQERIAVEAGIDEASASARISQYETGKHIPHFQIAIALARVVDVPVEFFYAVDDETSELLLRWHRLSKERRRMLLAALRQ